MVTVPMSVSAGPVEIPMSAAAEYVISGEVYEGPYAFTPTKAELTALTADRRLEQDMVIGAIPENYIDTTDADAGAGDIRTGKSGYVDGTKITGELIVPVLTQDGVTKILTIE